MPLGYARYTRLSFIRDPNPSASDFYRILSLGLRFPGDLDRYIRAADVAPRFSRHHRVG